MQTEFSAYIEVAIMYILLGVGLCLAAWLIGQAVRFVIQLMR